MDNVRLLTKIDDEQEKEIISKRIDRDVVTLYKLVRNVEMFMDNFNEILEEGSQ